MTTPIAPRRILISRTDRLGDCLLTLPLCGLLRQRYPDSELLYLGRAYTRPFVERCRHVTTFLDWDSMAGRPAREQTALLRDTRCDAVVHVLPRRAIAAAAQRAGIPRRIGTSRRWFQWLYCTERVPVGRRESPWHEAQLNVLMAGTLLDYDRDHPPSLDDLGAQFALVPPPPGAAVRAVLDPHRFNLVIHPLNLNSAQRWPLSRFADLIALLPAERFNVIVSGAGEERAGLRSWITGLSRPVAEAIGLEASDYMALIGGADGCVAPSTGPLHLAAALGVRALGLYPNPERSSLMRRWRPLGPRAEVISPREPCADCARLGPSCTCLARLDAVAVAAWVKEWQAESGTIGVTRPPDSAFDPSPSLVLGD